MDVCQVLNVEDNATMTIVAQWPDDETVTVTILREGSVPLYGQTSVDQQLREYPRPEVSRDKAVIEIRKELSGKQQANGTRFVLRGTRFSWKTKAWWKGGLDVRPIEDVVTLADMSLRWLNERAKFSYNEKDERREEKEEQDEEKESLFLKKNNIELAAKLHAAESTKKRMEQTLYSKFLLLLNEKKKKIRQLEEKLSKSNESRDGVSGERSARDEPYNQETDDESSSDQVPPSQPDLVIRPKRRSDAAPTTYNRPLKSRSERSCSPESDQDDIVLKFEDTPPDHPNGTEHDPDMLVSSSNNDQ